MMDFRAHVMWVAALCCMAPAQADLYFSEYVEGGGLNKALEIYNSGPAAVSLAGHEVRMYFNGGASPGNVIALSGTVNADSVFVLANAGADSAVIAVANQLDSGGWFNGDDAVELALGATTLDVVGQIGFDPGSAWSSGAASTANDTLRRKPTVTSGDSNGADAFDPAIEWDAFGQDVFGDLGSYLGGAGGPTPLDIYDIQGATHNSPALGTSVETTGIVTAVDGNGFYLQDPVGDGNDDTSDGIFVFTSSPPTVSAGDAVTVVGLVTEFIPGGPPTNNLSITEIIGPTVTVDSPGNPLPAPVILGNAGRLPPTEVIDNDNFAVFDPAQDGIDFYETVEGMRVTIDDAVAVAPTNRFNETVVVTDNGAFATGLNPRGGITISQTDFNPERIQVQIDTDLAPGPGVDIDTGDSLGDVTGVVSYSFGNFEVKATATFTPVSAGLAPETTALSGDGTHLTVATFNLLNLDPNPTDGDDDVGDGRFDALADQIVNSLAGPDIVGLQEIQDSDGSADTGTVDATLTYQTLIAAIDAAGGPSYDFLDLPPVNNADGGQPGGNIRNGYLYQPGRVSLVASSRILDPNLVDGDAYENSRKPVYAEFDFQGTSVHLVNVHFSSKGGSSPLFGVVQPPINGNSDRREDQAQIVNDFVDDLLAAGDDNVIVLGDVNEFEFESASQVLIGAPAPVLTNLTETLPPADRYTFIFDGNSQALDHILIGDALVAAGAEYDIVHANVEFDSQANDHEASIVRLALGGGDTDGDGEPDSTDNCTNVPNPDQYDSNGDNIGSLCDADIDGPGGVEDCFVNFIDLNAMKAAFFSNAASPSWNPDADLDNSGIVSFVDLQIVKAQFFGPPGPSAAGCN